MTKNIWWQLANPTNFIGNYDAIDPIIKKNSFFRTMQLLLLLYAARHTLIFISKGQYPVLRFHLLQLTRFLILKN